VLVHFENNRRSVCEDLVVVFNQSWLVQVNQVHAVLPHIALRLVKTSKDHKFRLSEIDDGIHVETNWLLKVDFSKPKLIRKKSKR
jgi:hypothetical protein